MRVMITRPKLDADLLAAELVFRDIEYLMEPMLEIIPMPSPALDLDGVQALLVTSANGVRALGTATERRDVALFAVGPATAATAAAAGFVSVTMAGGDVAALADLLEDRLAPADGDLLHVSASAVAGDLAGRLEAAGFEVQRAVLYEARPADALSESAIDAIRQDTIDAVLLFSPRTATSFVRLCEQASLALDRVRALCLSAAVAQQAGETQWADVAVAARPDQDALLALIETPPGD